MNKRQYLETVELIVLRAAARFPDKHSVEFKAIRTIADEIQKYLKDLIDE